MGCGGNGIVLLFASETAIRQFPPAALNTSFLNSLSRWQTVRLSNVDCQGITKILEDSSQGSQKMFLNVRLHVHKLTYMPGFICWKCSCLHVQIFAAIRLSGVLPPNTAHRAKGVFNANYWPITSQA